MHLNNHWIRYPQVRYSQTREHIWYLALPCLSFSTCLMGIIINASHVRNLAGAKCSGEMQQCKTDFVILAVSLTSPYSPTDISTADATTGLGKVLLNAWAFRFKLCVNAKYYSLCSSAAWKADGVFHLGDKYHPTFKYFLHNWAGSDTISSLNHPNPHQNAEDTVMGELSFDSPTAKPTYKRPVHFSKFLGF